jgi:hypothetical protein
LLRPRPLLPPLSFSPERELAEREDPLERELPPEFERELLERELPELPEREPPERELPPLEPLEPPERERLPPPLLELDSSSVMKFMACFLVREGRAAFPRARSITWMFAGNVDRARPAPARRPRAGP